MTGAELFAVMRGYAAPPDSGASAMLSLMDAEAPAEDLSTVGNP